MPAIGETSGSQSPKYLKKRIKVFIRQHINTSSPSNVQYVGHTLIEDVFYNVLKSFFSNKRKSWTEIKLLIFKQTTLKEITNKVISFIFYHRYYVFRHGQIRQHATISNCLSLRLRPNLQLIYMNEHKLYLLLPTCN